MKRTSIGIAAVLTLAALGTTRAALAEETPPPAEPPAAPAEPTPPPEAPKPKPPPYSIPWQLRPAAALTVVRSDTAFAKYEDAAARGGLTVATTLLASYKIPGTGGPGEGLSPLVRLAAVDDSPPVGNGGLAIVNPLVGGTYARKLGDVRLAGFLGVTVPIGAGGGDSPDAGLVNSRSKGLAARSAMDNALFAVNDLTVIPGFAAAWVASGLTVQAEVTLLHLMRVRGEAKQLEASKTNFTAGLHVGYFVIPQLSLGADLRYQRWVNPPIAVEKLRDAPVNADSAPMDQATFAIGPRFHQKVGDVWIRPGIAYARGLDKPMSGATPNTHIVQLDIPVVF